MYARALQEAEAQLVELRNDEFQRRRRAEHRMQDDEHGNAQLSDELDDGGAVLTAVDPELVLDDGDIKVLERHRSRLQRRGRAANELRDYLRTEAHRSGHVNGRDDTGSGKRHRPPQGGRERRDLALRRGIGTDVTRRK
jgi:hypothetical protein